MKLSSFQSIESINSCRLFFLRYLKQTTAFWFALTLLGCGSPATKQGLQTSNIADIVGPQSGRLWHSNALINSDFLDILMSFGYQRGQNCAQNVQERSANGDVSYFLEVHAGKCENFLIPREPIVTFSFVTFDNRDPQLPFLVTGNTRVGYFDLKSNAIGSLCLDAFARTCNLKISDDGQIQGLSLTGLGAQGKHANPFEDATFANSLLQFVNGCLVYQSFCWDDFHNGLFYRYGPVGSRIEDRSTWLMKPHPAIPFSNYHQLLALPQDELQEILSIADKWGENPMHYGLKFVSKSSSF